MPHSTTRAIRQILAEVPAVEKAVIYDSRAKGTHRPGSDIDLTLYVRENTERPITVTEGTNTVVGTDPGRIRIAFREVLQGGGKAGQVPEFWDGRAAERIAAAIHDWARGRQARG